MWVLYRVSDGKIVDIQPERAETPVSGAEYVFVKNADRERDLGGSVRGSVIERPVFVPAPRDPRTAKLDLIEQRLAALENPSLIRKN